MPLILRILCACPSACRYFGLVKMVTVSKEDIPQDFYGPLSKRIFCLCDLFSFQTNHFFLKMKEDVVFNAILIVNADNVTFSV